jgi:signal transduction histidine kinase
MMLRGWPRSLYRRILLVLALGLALAHALTFVLALTERSMTMRRAMVSYMASDVASSVAMLERLPAAERAQWVERLARRNYRYALTPPLSTPDDESGIARLIADAVGATLPTGQTVRVIDPHVPGTELRLQLQLSDGTPLAVDVDEPRLQVSSWVLGALALQLALLVGLCAWAVRAATRPLNALADAADALGADRPVVPLSEDGPQEVVRAATAFNRMQQRIQAHLQERMQILAAVSHDLQTPITRLRLRADLLDDNTLRDKLHADLAEMQSLVEEGIAYARSPMAVREPVQWVDLQALVESIACDYADAGLAVQVQHVAEISDATRPKALRRLACNLIDNALKFAGSAELSLELVAPGHWLLRVRDHGPGIAPAELSAVLQPYVRLEDSRNRHTGGTGLGLAIASELAKAVGGKLVLGARKDGKKGLEAMVEVQTRAGATVLRQETQPQPLDRLVERKIRPPLV